MFLQCSNLGKNPTVLIFRQKANYDVHPRLILPFSSAALHRDSKQNWAHVKGFESPTLRRCNFRSTRTPQRAASLSVPCRNSREAAVTDALRAPLGICLPFSTSRAGFARWVKAGTEHLPDDSMTVGSSPCLSKVSGKILTDFRGWS